MCHGCSATTLCTGMLAATCYMEENEAKRARKGIKGNEMAGDLYQIGRAEGGLKVSEKMPLGALINVGEFQKKKKKKSKQQQFKEALRQPQQRKWKNKNPQKTGREAK